MDKNLESCSVQVVVFYCFITAWLPSPQTLPVHPEKLYTAQRWHRSGSLVSDSIIKAYAQFSNTEQFYVTTEKIYLESRHIIGKIILKTY